MNKPIGRVVHYYDNLGVAIIDIKSGQLKVGDEIKLVKGENGFKQKIESLQVDHQNVESVKAGDSFGVKVEKPTKPGTLVYLA